MINAHKVQTLTLILVLLLCASSCFHRDNNQELVVPEALPISSSATENYKADEDASNYIVLESGVGRSHTQALVYGTTSGNAYNMGLASTDGHWIVYANGTDDRGSSDCKLYCADIQLENTVKLTDDKAAYVNLVNDWVYYSNISDGGALYKISIDGTQCEKMNDHQSLGVFVVDDFIYYVNESTLYKMKTDKSIIMEITNEARYEFCVYDGWIYFQKRNEAAGKGVFAVYPGPIYRISVDGTNEVKISDVESYGFVISDDWIYYYISGENYGLYKMTLDGRVVDAVNRNITGAYNVSDGWIYYHNYGHKNSGERSGLFRVRDDGTKRERISSDSGHPGALNIVGEWIFYLQEVFNYGDTVDYTEQYRMRLDGSEKRLVYSDKPPVIIDEGPLMNPSFDIEILYGYWADIYVWARGLDIYCDCDAEITYALWLEGFSFREDGKTGLMYTNHDGPIDIILYYVQKDTLSVFYSTMEEETVYDDYNISIISDNEIIIKRMEYGKPIGIGRRFLRMKEIVSTSNRGGYIVTQMDGSAINIQGH